jgi:thiamine kinase-like enzyme
MSTSYTSKIRGPFKSLDRVEQALKQTQSLLHSPIKSLTDITTIPSRDRVALLVEFVNELRVKLVVLGSEKQSLEFVQRCLELPPEIKVPSVLLVEEGWAAFEWIEGPTLDQHGMTDDLLREAAQLLAEIHAVRPKVTTESVVSQVQQKLNDKLPMLLTHRIISERAGDLIIKMCDSISSSSVETSLIHGDFSPSNLVVSKSGLFSIDNEKLADHVPEYDLCRTLNLWDEWNSSGTALFDAYCESVPRKVDRERLFFWTVFDLVYRISYRLSLGEVNHFCVNRLRQMVPN